MPADTFGVVVENRPRMKPGCTQRQIKFRSGHGNNECAFGVANDIRDKSINLVAGNEAGKLGRADVSEALF